LVLGVIAGVEAKFEVHKNRDISHLIFGGSDLEAISEIALGRSLFKITHIENYLNRLLKNNN